MQFERNPGIMEPWNLETKHGTSIALGVQRPANAPIASGIPAFLKTLFLLRDSSLQFERNTGTMEPWNLETKHGTSIALGVQRLANADQAKFWLQGT